MILITAQRPGEVLGIHTQEIEGTWWTIPATRSKNGKAHRVYLTELALNLIKKLEVEDGFLFKSPRPIKPVDENALPVNKPVGENVMAHALRKNIKGYEPKRKVASSTGKKNRKENVDESRKMTIAFFRPHDLRRTARTHMSRLGILSEYAERVLNHLPSDVRKHYDTDITVNPTTYV